MLNAKEELLKEEECYLITTTVPVILREQTQLESQQETTRENINLENKEELDRPKRKTGRARLHPRRNFPTFSSKRPMAGNA